MQHLYTYDPIFTCGPNYVTPFRQQHVQIFLLMQLQHGFLFVYSCRLSFFLSLRHFSLCTEAFCFFCQFMFYSRHITLRLKYTLESTRVHRYSKTLTKILDIFMLNSNFGCDVERNLGFKYIVQITLIFFTLKFD